MIDLLLTLVAVVAIWMTIWYLASLLLKDASIVDIAWGLNFIIAAWVIYSERPTKLGLIMALMITIWGLRLSAYIAYRRIGQPEDWRYAKWRQEWGNEFGLKSYYRIFLLQGILSLCICLPLLLNVMSGTGQFNALTWIGIVIWLIGFAYESIADGQMQRFKTKHPDKLITTGLWAFSRHPNYLGEILQWWGIWVVSYTTLTTLLGVLSPMLLTALILGVSGVPMKEARHREKYKKAFTEYAAKTKLLVPGIV